MITIEIVAALAQLLDPRKNQCPILVKRKSWRNVEGQFEVARNLNNRLFGTEEQILIDRNSVFRTRDRDIFLQKVLFWGFPTGMHGVGKSALNNWDNLCRLYSYLKTHRNMCRAEYRQVVDNHFKQMKGLSLTFFSKLLYFMNVTIDGTPAVINDEFLRKGIKKVTGPEILPLKKAAKYRYSSYPDFLNEMVSLASNLHSTPERLEYVLWLIGKN
jgi:hypothetical protein